MPFSFSDINISVSLFLGLYGIFLLGYVVYGFFNLLHLLEYGRVGAPLFMIVIGFVGGTILLVAATIFWLLQYDLTYSVTFAETLSLFKQTFLHSGSF